MYDFRKTLVKGLKALLISAGAVAGSAAAAYLSDPAVVTKALSGSFTPAVIALAVPVVTGAAHMLADYLKNRTP